MSLSAALFKFVLSRQRVSSAELCQAVLGPCELSIDSAVMEKLKSREMELHDIKNVLIESNAVQQLLSKNLESRFFGNEKNQKNQKNQDSIENEKHENVDIVEENKGKDIFLNIADTRAAIVALMVTLVHGRANIRIVILLHLLQMLNSNILPRIRKGTDENMLAQIVLASYELGEMQMGNEIGRLTDFGMKAVKWSLKEIETIVKGTFAFSVGIALKAAYGLSQLVDTADAIAALTCEALQSSVYALELSNYDPHHPHKGMLTCANNIRALVEQSKNIDDFKRKEQSAIIVREIPQYHGPARDVLEHAHRSLTIEFNSAIGNYGCEPKDLSFHPQAIITHSLNLLNVTILMFIGSFQRLELLKPEESQVLKYEFSALQLLRKSLPQPECFDVANASGYAASVAFHFSSSVFNLLHVLSFEATVSLQSLAEREKLVLEISSKQLEASEARRIAREAEMANDEKFAKKLHEKKKEEKKKPKGLMLGNGSKLIRSFLNFNEIPLAEISEANFVELKTTEEVDCALKSISSRISPFTASTWFDFITPLLLAASQSMKKPKIAKGARDTLPEQMMIREKAFAKILAVFRRHGAVGIDTPVFELRETLTGKYGEDSKLIYDLADQGGELLSLRYDLTVPFARFLAMSTNTQIKRYHIAKVYRRDNPAMNRGRFREFHQCDFDIAGNYGSMIPDADVIKVVTEILDDLQIGKYVVKLNHRKLLDAMMAVCGVPPAKFRTICSAIDKLDKETWEDVKIEMVDQKGLDPQVADRIGEYVRANGQYVLEKHNPLLVLELLQKNPAFAGNTAASTAFEELALLFRYLRAFNCIDRVHFDMSLARGLDYYTGVIYEAILIDSDRVGSIAAGGRYDGLVGRFSGTDVPAVGVSIGIERILTIMEDQERSRGNVRATTTEVFVCSFGADLLETRMSICAELWQAGIAAEFAYKENPKLPAQLTFAYDNNIPFAVIFRNEKITKGIVKIKDLLSKNETEVKREDLVNHLRALIREQK